MQHRPLLFLCFFIFCVEFSAFTQEFTLSKTQLETVNNQATELLESYETSLNNLGDPLTTVQEKNYFLTDIVENIFEGEDVLIHNDLDPDDLESKDLTVNVYLNNIIAKYNKGLQFIFSDIQISEPFYLDESSFFIKIELASNLDGIHIEQPISNFEPLDIYIKYTIDELYNISTPTIYSITSHRENLKQFTPVPIDEGDNTFNFSFENPAKGKNFRRGKEQRLAWKGNDDTVPVRLELFKGNKMLFTVNPVVVGNSYVWRIPADMNLGNDYRIQIVNLKNTDNTAISPEFSIKRKVPLGLKIAGLAGIGAIVYFVVTRESGEEEESLLPLPPDFP